ncbi:MAG TPA: hypothetical protein VGX68_07775 [Thermoanaerobaculia bacterium]|nr:hypothetical protein [Thermoanaerobaculia bacterium]
MKRKGIQLLLCSTAVLVLASLLPTRPAAADKCASCPDQLKACKTFCGSNNVVFDCQNHNPCAGTCTCG